MANKKASGNSNDKDNGKDNGNGKSAFGFAPRQVDDRKYNCNRSQRLRQGNNNDGEGE
jgi:hypothetical protein